MHFKHHRTATHLLERTAKWIFFVSVCVCIVTYWQKDTLPNPDNYLYEKLTDPIQKKTHRKPFLTVVNDQQYAIKPLYDYELEGVVVSLHNADELGDIWHHEKWLDFINVRDLCVIWGHNVHGGVYQDMTFSNDSWTCRASWPNRGVGSQFVKAQLSNNHLLADNDSIKEKLMSAEVGDVIRLKGVLAIYANPSNNFIRGSSIVRDDVGNGACETIYLEEFSVVEKANKGLRTLHEFAKWLALISLIVFMYFVVFSKNHR